jgi:RNA polymerase sigma-70 factor (ECF subfamily)
VGPTDESAETKALARDLADAMDEAINELPDTLKVAFVLRDVEELSTLEVAEVLGIRASAVKMGLARAREQLRERLGERLWD